MTFWLDAHLDPDLAAWLGSQFGVVVKPLREIGLRDADDDVLYAAGRRFAGIVIVTKDADFAALGRRLGAPPQVLWLRCGNLTTIEMQAMLSRRFADAVRRLRAGEAIVEMVAT